MSSQTPAIKQIVNVRSEHQTYIDCQFIGNKISNYIKHLSIILYFEQHKVDKNEISVLM